MEFWMNCPDEIRRRYEEKHNEMFDDTKQITPKTDVEFCSW